MPTTRQPAPFRSDLLKKHLLTSDFLKRYNINNTILRNGKAR